MPSSAIDQDLFEHLCQASGLGWVAVDGSGLASRANAAFLKLAGCAPADLPRRFPGLSAALSQTVETELARPDGTSAAVLAGPSGTPAAADGTVILFVLDSSARRRSDEALKHRTEELQRSNTDLTLFAAMASHDLQEPLRKIQGFGELLRSRDGKKLSPEGSDYLSRMQDAAARLKTLITDLLALSGVTSKSDPHVAVDLAEELRIVLGDLEVPIRETGAVIEIGKMPRLQADRTQMRQLFQNLIGNALKFRRPGAAPRVSIESRVTKPGFVELTVSDNGIGFEDREARRIFQPFQRLHPRTQYPGSGMGLAVCERIALRHGGAITAHGVPGQGSTFTVTLPTPFGGPR
jgi:light-regulated signal transduction histidine kinase (bacteriophytochrome)